MKLSKNTQNTKNILKFLVKQNNVYKTKKKNN